MVQPVRSPHPDCRSDSTRKVGELKQVVIPARVGVWVSVCKCVPQPCAISHTKTMPASHCTYAPHLTKAAAPGTLQWQRYCPAPCRAQRGPFSQQHPPACVRVRVCKCVRVCVRVRMCCTCACAQVYVRGSTPYTHLRDSWAGPLVILHPAAMHSRQAPCLHHTLLSPPTKHRPPASAITPRTGPSSSPILQPSTAAHCTRAMPPCRQCHSCQPLKAACTALPPCLTSACAALSAFRPCEWLSMTWEAWRLGAGFGIGFGVGSGGGMAGMDFVNDCRVRAWNGIL